MRGLPSDIPLHDLYGVPTTRSSAESAPPTEHANGVTAIDHVVLLSPDLNRTVESLAGSVPRRRGHRCDRFVLRWAHSTGQGNGAARAPDHHAAASRVRDVGPNGDALGVRASLTRLLNAVPILCS